MQTQLNDFGKYLKGLRREKGISLSEMTDLIKKEQGHAHSFSKPTLSVYERGAGLPPKHKLPILERAYGVSERDEFLQLYKKVKLLREDTIVVHGHSLAVVLDNISKGRHFKPI
jgi:transcriptional regulator with XRE-family HTH domain